MQEPWCFHPDQVATLTDDQIVNRYLKPAIERSERAGVSGGGESVGPRRSAPAASTGPPGEPGSPEHRNACINAYVQVQGLKHERAVAQYEKQLAQYHAEKVP